MEALTKTLRYNSLFRIYGNLLSSTQKEILNDYFCYDLSITEIAEARNISRAAVDDALKKGVKKLEEFETSLNLLEKSEEILKNASKIKNLSKDKEILECVDGIERNVR